MAISNLLPAGGANDNRSNLKQFFGKNPAIANDNVERVSSGMFTNAFVDSVVTTLQGLINEIAKITDMAKSVITSFGTIIKSLKSLNKDVTSRFRVLNNELNASKIDFIRTVLAIPKTEAPVKIDGVPVNVNTPQEPVKKEEDKGFDIGELLAAYLGLKGGGAVLKTIGNGLLALANPYTLLAFLAAGTAIWLAWELKQLYEGMINSKEFKDWSKHQEGKTEEMMRDEIAKAFRNKNDPTGRSGRTQEREAFDAKKFVLPDGSILNHSMVKAIPKNDRGEEIWIFKDDIKKKVGFAGINIVTGEQYSAVEDATTGHFKGTVVPGTEAPAAPAQPGPAAPSAPAAPAGARGGDGTPTPSAGPAYRYPGFKDLNESRSSSTEPAKVTSGEAPAGSPAGEVKKESNTQAPPPSGRPSLKGAIASAIPVPPAGPSGGEGAGSGGGVAVVQNSSVQNVGSTAGAETGGMTGQNLPMFARNPKLQESFGKQTVKYQ
jgi:hypothetical protein